MHSLRTRLLGLSGLSLGACVAVGLLLVQLDRQSTEALVGRAEAMAAHACDLVRDRYDFHATGSDRDRIGAWPEKGIPGTQLGPNRNGRKW